MQNILLASIFVWQRKNIREKGIRHIKKFGVGAVLFSQRFGDSLNLNVHFHVVLPDGVFLRAESSKVIFQPIVAPRDEDLQNCYSYRAKNSLFTRKARTSSTTKQYK